MITPRDPPGTCPPVTMFTAVCLRPCRHGSPEMIANLPGRRGTSFAARTLPFNMVGRLQKLRQRRVAPGDAVHCILEARSATGWATPVESVRQSPSCGRCSRASIHGQIGPSPGRHICSILLEGATFLRRGAAHRGASTLFGKIPPLKPRSVFASTFGPTFHPISCCSSSACCNVPRHVQRNAGDHPYRNAGDDPPVAASTDPFRHVSPCDQHRRRHADAAV